MHDLNELKNFQEEIQAIVKLMKDAISTLDKMGPAKFQPSGVLCLLKAFGWICEAEQDLFAPPMEPTESWLKI